jgi:glycosyltransferase involved in cell wall biosynthesis
LTALQLDAIRQIGRQTRDITVAILFVLRSAIKLSLRNEEKTARRLTIVQFGDYAEGFFRLQSGGAENYYAQKYSVDYVASLTLRRDLASITVISLEGDAPNITLPNGIHTMGIKLYREGQHARHGELLRAVHESNPTHLIIMSPIIPLISWGLRAAIPVLPMFADSFRATGVKARLKHWLLARLLNAPLIEFVSNHNLAAALDLRNIGVSGRKIVPFDWPPLISPSGFAAKESPSTDGPFRLIYVGSVIETKGVTDAVMAVARLRDHGRRFELTIIGRGDLDSIRALAKKESLEQQIHVLGVRSHTEVIAAMRDHDAVVVPSHWAHPEGLPMTLYEALCTRTPLLTSDHPMFALKIKDHYNALVFPERNPEAFANRIAELASSPRLYSRLSLNSGNAAEGYLCPLKYDQLITEFLSAEERANLQRYSLEKYDYTP